MKFETHRHLWGYEEWICNNDLYAAKYLNLRRGYQSSLHCHVNKDETFIVLKGVIELEVGSGNLERMKIILKSGDKFRLNPRTYHRFKAMTRKAKILEISTTHEDSDTVRKEKARKIK